MVRLMFRLPAKPGAGLSPLAIPTAKTLPKEPFKLSAEQQRFRLKRKPAEGLLEVTLHLWSRPRYEIWTAKGYVPIRSLQAARDYAATHGYAGITVNPV